MIKLDKPTLDPEEVYWDCISSFNKDPRLRLIPCSPLILTAAVEFDSKITTGQVYTIVRETTVNGNVTAKELVKVYTQKMVGHEDVRHYYDHIVLSTDLCPLCAHRNVSTIDHYLPKANYPRLAVVPINLVPACNDCQDKLIDYPTSPATETLHPYYDDIDVDTWLKAEINITDPISISYTIDKPASWNQLLFDRVSSHLYSYRLKKLYSVQAGRRLSGMKRLLINLHLDGGEPAIRKFLQDSAESQEEVMNNSWESSLFRCLSSSDWFCSGGFNSI